MTKETTMTTTEILIAARAKIERPQDWIQGRFAVSSLQNKVKPTSRRASCWCALGAIAAITREDPNDVNDELYWLLCRAMGLPDNEIAVAAWNDAPGRTHAEVLAVFDRAIEAASIGENRTDMCLDEDDRSAGE